MAPTFAASSAVYANLIRVVGTNDRLVDPGQRPIHAASGFVPFQSFCSAPATKGLEGALEVQERNDRIGDKILQEGFRRQKGTCRNPRYWLYGGVHSVKFIGVVWFMLCRGFKCSRGSN